MSKRVLRGNSNRDTGWCPKILCLLLSLSRIPSASCFSLAPSDKSAIVLGKKYSSFKPFWRPSGLSLLFLCYRSPKRNVQNVLIYFFFFSLKTSREFLFVSVFIEIIIWAETQLSAGTLAAQWPIYEEGRRAWGQFYWNACFQNASDTSIHMVHPGNPVVPYFLVHVTKATDILPAFRVARTVTVMRYSISCAALSIYISQ